MKIEHVAFQVQDPVAVAQWYVENLGFRIVRAGGPPGYGHFLADEKGETVLEIYNNPEIPVPDYATMHPMTLHLAVIVEDVPAAVRRLVKAGASKEGDLLTTPAGDKHALVRDPWGFCLQLMHRAQPLL